MADTTTATANTAEEWDTSFFKEYVHDSDFKPWMGKSENSVIQIKEQLSKNKGESITVSLVGKLSGAGVTGSSTLEGNEEALDNWGHKITVDQIRNGVRVSVMEEQKAKFPLRDAGKTMLKLWSMESLRDAHIAAMQSPVVDGVTTYAAASEAQKDAWLTANADRVLFGAAKSNGSSNDHSVALATIDNTNDKLSTTTASLLRRMMKTATKKVRPIKIAGGTEWYVCFVPTLPFRDLKADSVLTQANREAMNRGKNNPLFQDGDLMYDGIIFHEVPDIPVISGVGNGGIDVAPVFMCGAQALGWAVAQRSQTALETFDYGDKHGVAVSEIRGVEKLMFNDIQHGMGTHYVAAVADS